MTTSSNYWSSKEIHVFDVDAFINEVYNRFSGTPNEETREDLEQLFHKVLAMPRGGDRSLYPNAHGHRPALLEVWHKAADFWRANGFQKPARLLCDQNGFPIDALALQMIEAAKAAISNADPFSVGDGSAVAAAAQAAETAQDAQTGTAGTTAHPATATPTEAAQQPTEAAPDTIAQPEAIDTPDTATDTQPRRKPRQLTLFPTLAAFFTAKTMITVAKGIGILASLLVICKCGLIIPFALAGGFITGVVK